MPALSTGSPGSGTEIIAVRLLRAAGVDPDREVTRQALGVSESAGALEDGKIAARHGQVTLDDVGGELVGIEPDGTGEGGFGLAELARV